VDKDERNSGGVLCDEEPVALCHLLVAVLPIRICYSCPATNHHQQLPAHSASLPPRSPLAPCPCPAAFSSFHLCARMKLATACRTVWRTKKSACYPGELPVYGCGTISCPVLKIKRSRCFPVGRCGRSCPSPSKFNVLALVVATSTVAPTRLNRRTWLSLTSLEIGVQVVSIGLLLIDGNERLRGKLMILQLPDQIMAWRGTCLITTQ
jgi:hypothetical protein